ncbi:MAG: hypothetical protein OEY33_01425 [Bdellovibrionales bacterium]|nr:hypothetical protein [Bdellovibrionales bacterium]
MKKLINILLILSFAVIAQGCKGTAAERFVNGINAESANLVTLVKDPTRVSGYIILKEGDTFYALKHTRYWFWGNSDRYSKYEYYLAKRFEVDYVGDGYYRGPLGRLYEETSASSKDLEFAGAVTEEIKINNMAEKIQTQFGFSTERSLEVAELTSHWNKLSKSRAMTQADKDLFAQKLLGVNYNKVESALSDIEVADMSSTEEILENAAQVNGVSREQMRELIEEYLLR